jgi:hypothetical protein
MRSFRRVHFSDAAIAASEIAAASEEVFTIPIGINYQNTVRSTSALRPDDLCVSRLKIRQ